MVPPCPRSEAKCLGAKTVCRQALDYSVCGEPAVISEVVTDRQALHAVETFLGESLCGRRPDPEVSGPV